MSEAGHGVGRHRGGAEPTSGELIAGYAAPLAAITPIASLIGGVVIGRTIPFIGTYHMPLAAGLVTAVVTYPLALVGVFVLSLIINALAPSFGGQQGQHRGAEGGRLRVHAGLGGGRRSRSSPRWACWS